jgi:hypothetical protein
MVRKPDRRRGVRGASTVRLATGALLTGAAFAMAISGAPAAPGGTSVPTGARGPVDLSSRVNIRSGECSFGPRLERALAGMITYEGSPPAARAGHVTLAGQRLAVSLTSSPDESRETTEIQNQDAVVRLRPAARWHGLRLTGLRQSTGWEWAASSLEFSDSPARVRAALRRMGISVPLPPGTRDIPTEECSASLAIEARPNGSALTCSSGC